MKIMRIGIDLAKTVLQVHIVEQGFVITVRSAYAASLKLECLSASSLISARYASISTNCA